MDSAFHEAFLFAEKVNNQQIEQTTSGLRVRTAANRIEALCNSKSR